MFSRILVPVDGSDPSNEAVQLAVRLAAESKATLAFVHVIELDKVVAMSGTVPSDPSIAVKALETAGSAILDGAKQAAEKAGVSATCELLEGDCIPAVLESGARWKADLIVIGSHGRGGLSRMLLGSVAEGILRHSAIPVLVYRATKTPESPALGQSRRRFYAVPV